LRLLETAFLSSFQYLICSPIQKSERSPKDLTMHITSIDWPDLGKIFDGFFGRILIIRILEVGVGKD